MKNLLFFPLIGILAVAFGCTKSKSETKETCPGGTDVFMLGEAFTLCYGTSATLQGGSAFELRFDTLFGDSRCSLQPTQDCVWQGRADAGFSATLGGATQTDTLSAQGLTEVAAFDSVQVGSYKIKLLGIEPYPYLSTPIPNEDYKMRLLVEQ
jgi:hypothetical protein